MNKTENTDSFMNDTQLTDDDKIRLFNGVGSWKTFDANGKIPYFFMSDGPHGLRKQDEEDYSDLNKSRVATCFPTASCMAGSWDKNLLKKLGQAIATEALCQDVNIVLGPGINIKRSPLCGRNFEYFSEDPYLAGTLAAEYIKGMQSLGAGTSLKHYACNNQEKRRQVSNSIVDEKTLSEIYLRAFEIAVRNAKPASVMVSYNKVNGEYAAASRFLLTEILRKKWGFKGIVISDWGACIDAAKCLKAGMTLAMPDSYDYFDKQLKAVYSDDEIKQKLSESNRMIIETARKWKKSDTDNHTKIDFEKQHQTALELACNSAVLLKNDGILPIKTKTEKTAAQNEQSPAPQKIAVIGSLAEFMKFQGGGSSHITTASYPNALESLKKCGFNVEYAPGYSVKIGNHTKKYYSKALALAKKAAEEKIPVLFFCGLTEEFEGEGFDRTTLSLPEVQTELLDKVIQTGADIIAVTFSGSPIDLYFEDKVRAILHMYLCGEACAEACAELLSGHVNPSGKLAETFPLSEKDIPCYGNFATEDDNIEYKEGCLVGYRHYQAKNIPVRYEFGFGLSYTTFEYSGLEVDVKNRCATLDVKNTGSVAGMETVQIYVRKKDDENSSIAADAKTAATVTAAADKTQNETCTSYPELRGFEKVRLEAGETARVKITLDDNAFKTYDTACHAFTEQPGDYEIMAAKSIRRIEQKVIVKIEKNTADTVADTTSAQIIRGNSENTGKEKDTQLSMDNSDYTPDEELYKAFFTGCRVSPHHKGTFTTADNLGDMTKESFFVKILLFFIEKAMIVSSHGKSRNDPSVRIAISALRENPLESLISTSGGALSEKFVSRIIKKANKRRN